MGRTLSGQALATRFFNTIAWLLKRAQTNCSILQAKCYLTRFFPCPNSRNFCPFLNLHVGCIFVVSIKNNNKIFIVITLNNHLFREIKNNTIMDIQLAQTDFENVVQNNSNVLLDFYADWCGPCQTLLPTIHKLADELKDDVVIRKVNVDENQELAAKFHIRSIPTLVFFKDGKPADSHTGLISDANLRSKINRLK